MSCEQIRLSLWQLGPCLLAVAAAVGVPGCSGGQAETYPVTVKVAYPDGSTLQGAIVVFQSAGDPDAEGEGKSYSAVGKVRADGTCRLTTFTPGDGAVAGLHGVTVALPPAAGDPDETSSQPARLHPRFRSADTSDLEFTVTPEGPNEFSIQIERP